MTGQSLVERPALGDGIDIGQLTPEQLSLIKNHICKPKHRQATDEELALFIGQCNRTGLDPFAKQIYAIFRGSREKQGNQWVSVEKMGIQASIDGLRLVAKRTGRYDGQLDAEWCGPDAVWSDVWLKAEPPRAARARVLVHGAAAPTPATAHYDEYVVLSDEYQNGNKTGRKVPGGLWADKPRLMLAKCAEALALRKAFPQELSGLYIAEEMGRADIEAEAVATDLPETRSVPELPAHDAGEEALALDQANRELMNLLGFSARKQEATHDGYRTLEQKQQLHTKLQNALDEQGQAA